jgi:hypothetical protein
MLAIVYGFGGERGRVARKMERTSAAGTVVPDRPGSNLVQTCFFFPCVISSRQRGWYIFVLLDQVSRLLAFCDKEQRKRRWIKSMR